MDKNIAVVTGVCVIALSNGQTVETEVQVKSIKKAREKLKTHKHLSKIISVKRFTM